MDLILLISLMHLLNWLSNITLIPLAWPFHDRLTMMLLRHIWLNIMLWLPLLLMLPLLLEWHGSLIMN